MELYKIDLNYYNYLHYYENKIPYIENEKKNRPFVGVILNVNGKNFFAPLTSPKKKHLTMKNMQDFLKIDNGKLGGINLNNMIPVPKSYLEKIEINQIKDYKYKYMLKEQLNWINKNQLRIQNRARNLYYLILFNHAQEQLIQRCCNFKLLEQKCNDFMKENNVKEQEIFYSFFEAC